MEITVLGSRNNEYTVDTEAVTCTCADFRFRCCHFPVTNEARQCKHIREVFSKNPEYMPADVARAMKELDKKIEEVTSSSAALPFIIASTYFELVRADLGSSLGQVIGEYARQSDMVSTLEFITDNLSKIKEVAQNWIELLGWTVELDSDDCFTVMADRILPISWKLVAPEAYVPQLLFSSCSEAEMQVLQTKAQRKGVSLSPTGVRSLNSEGTVHWFETKEELLQFLNS